MRKYTILFSFYSMSASQVHFSTYNITIYNKAFMSSWHEALFYYQVLRHFWTAELRTSEKASTKSCSELSPYFPDLFKYLILTLCTVELTRCSVPVRCLLTSPTALCGEKFALFNNYCTLAWLLQLSVQRWLSKCHMPMIEMKNLLLPLSCVPRKMLSSRSFRRKRKSIFSFSFLSCPFFLFVFWQQWRMGYIKTAC